MILYCIIVSYLEPTFPRMGIIYAVIIIIIICYNLTAYA